MEFSQMNICLNGRVVCWLNRCSKTKYRFHGDFSMHTDETVQLD